MSKPNFAVAVTFEIHPEHAEKFKQRVLQQARDSVTKEEHCHQFDVLVDEANPNIVFLYETYTDADAFAAHRETPWFADFYATVSPWIANKDLRRLLHA